MPSRNMTSLMNVKTFSRTIAQYVRPELGGSGFPCPAARRAATSSLVKPVEGVDGIDTVG
jgi:hypothetical protein